MLQLFRDEGKQILKLAPTEFSGQLSDNYLHGKLSFLPTTQVGLKTRYYMAEREVEKEKGKEGRMQGERDRGRDRHTHTPPTPQPPTTGHRQILKFECIC